MTYRDRLQLEDELKREFFGLLERHTMFRRLPVRKKEEMARAARLDEIFVRLCAPTTRSFGALLARTPPDAVRCRARLTSCRQPCPEFWLLQRDRILATRSVFRDSSYPVIYDCHPGKTMNP